MLVSFEDPQLGDAADELEQLGHNFACEVLLYLQKVHCGSVDSRDLSPFYTYRGVEMFQAVSANKFVIFAVEFDDIDDVTVTLMLAGEHGVPMSAGGSSWNGNDYSVLKTGILNARASVWFV
ncbi:hypothetical protein AYJ54_24610 [Bradyrhizobium centrolobii]|uniref:Uncharacterized protein n=1 Tax=Bradyrhizobium centrolobii TaxID=1505087 RepID=A0A176YFT7_9BRAD|nr:hypothetical protein [Bradyrhizobium centrolobii]OAF04038.1 hypothetical protein AYJ54_24610 [Bradyrhizobium centrolobii]